MAAFLEEEAIFLELALVGSSAVVDEREEKLVEAAAVEGEEEEEEEEVSEIPCFQHLLE